MQSYHKGIGIGAMKTTLLARVRRWQAQGERNGFGGGWLYLSATGKLLLAHRPDLHAASRILMRIDGNCVRRYGDRGALPA